jgi:RNA polymerase sigma-70 factor, ECF subfamily
MLPSLACISAQGGSVRALGEHGLDEAVTESVVELYDRHFHFVWRSLRRLGVAAVDLDDAVQDVFVVVHRKLDTFEGRGAIEGWIFGIALRVAKAYRRRVARRRLHVAEDESVLVCKRGTPEEARACMQAAEQVQELLDGLDDDKRAVFVLCELEHMQAPEVAAALGISRNTVSSRLRLARAAFELGLKRLNAKDDWRYR